MALNIARPTAMASQCRPSGDEAYHEETKRRRDENPKVDGLALFADIILPKFMGDRFTPILPQALRQGEKGHGGMIFVILFPWL
jgi:hypothetical protein